MSQLDFIAVPGGVDGEGLNITLNLRVLIVPRLPSGTVESAGMRDWPPPNLLRRDAIEVDFLRSLGDSAQVARIDPPHVKAQPNLWGAFFPPDLPVKLALERSAATRLVEVDDTSRLARAIKSTFGRMAAKAVASDVLTAPDAAAAFGAAVRAELATWNSDAMAPTLHTPIQAQNIAPDPPDFHSIVSMLREHPEILQRLGLIFSLSIKSQHFAALDTLPQQPGLLRIRWPNSAASGFNIASPWTRHGADFRPASTATISSGMVAISDDESGPLAQQWSITTVDVDNGARRFRDAARAVQTAGATTDDRRVSLPALRSAGIILLRLNRQADFASRHEAALRHSKHASINEATLDADDLTLGYRIDIQHGGEWYSLHSRVSSYQVGPQDNFVRIAVEEEGQLKARAAIDYGDGRLHADEIVARWHGWSLSARRPAFDPRVPKPTADAPNFRWTSEVKPQSLPVLRFGDTYRMRARVADAAGGGLLLLDTAANRCFSDTKVYQRYEPVSPPSIAMLPNAKLGSGENVNLIVIRSDSGISVDDFAAANPDIPRNFNRLLSPPRTSLMLAEQHGAFDHLTDEQSWAHVSQALAATVPDSSVSALPDYAVANLCVFTVREPGGVTVAAVDRPWKGRWPAIQPKLVEVKERANGATSVFVWKDTPDGDKLIVSLAKGEQVTLELSSSVRDGMFDHFAVQGETPGDEAVRQISAGRHPMVTPSNRLTILHAVRRPLNPPQGLLVARRDPGETTAVLDHTADPLLNIDPKSSSQLEVDATWTDVVDGPEPPKRQNIPVQIIPVDRSDQALRDVIRHEFGDTRHRQVTYRLTAVSRFKTCFDPHTDPEDFLQRTVLQVVSVPSSARPPPLTLLSARPAFSWKKTFETTGATTTLRRQRVGGRIRVELAGPWYATGEDERLAVIVWKNNEAPVAPRPYLSQVGRDPIWYTGDPKRWKLSFNDYDGDFGVHKLAETGLEIVAVPYRVWPRDGRWYADIGLEAVAQSSYSPLAQLALARYQRSSLKDLELSQVVKTEIVPLLPNRLLTVRQTGDDISISLEGIVPSQSAKTFSVALEECLVPVDIPRDSIDITALGTLPESFTAWAAVPGQVQHGLVNGPSLRIRLPLGGGRFRLRAREIEPIGRTGTELPRTGTEDELNERVVYTDVVDLPLS